MYILRGTSCVLQRVSLAAENRVLRGPAGEERLAVSYGELVVWSVAPCLTVLTCTARRVLRCVCIYLVAGYLATPCLTAYVRIYIYIVAHFCTVSYGVP